MKVFHIGAAWGVGRRLALAGMPSAIRRAGTCTFGETTAPAATTAPSSTRPPLSTTEPEASERAAAARHRH